MSGMNSRHHNLPTYEMSLKSDNVEFMWYYGGHFENGDRLRFQNGHHNTAKIQHCSISKVAFNFFFKPVVSGRIGRLKFWWYWTMLNFYCPFLIPYFGSHFQNGKHLEIFKTQNYSSTNWFPTLKNFYRSPFSKWPPQYRTNSTLSDFNDISYVGRLWCPEMIPDIEKFLPVAIFKMGFP
jgi:hypothetical protein